MKAIGNALYEAPYGLPVRLADAAGIALFDPSGYAETAPTLQSGVRGSRVGTFTGQPSDNDTLTITRVDASTVVYRYKNTLAQKNDVKIGADQDATLTSLYKAMTGTGTVGTDYYANTEPVLDDFEIAADTGGNTITLTATNFGDYANTAIAAFAESQANFTWAAATSGVDTADYLQYHDNSGTAITDAAAVSAQPVIRAGEAKVAPVAGQLTCKRYTGVLQDNSVNAGGDDTASSVFLRRQFTVVTTHHPAAGDPKGVVYVGRLLTPNDLPASGLYIDIPANASHADYSASLPFGGLYGVPETDDICANMWIEVFDERTGVRDVAEIKSYDPNGGASANEGRATFAVGGGLKFATTLRACSQLKYRVYESNIGRVAELATQASTDVQAAANAALVAQKLDHLVAQPDSDDPATNSIIAKLAAASGDWSDFDPASSALSMLSAMLSYFGVTTGDVNDVSATATSFTVTSNVGADKIFGTLRFTSGALTNESRLVLHTGTTVTVMPSSAVTGLAGLDAFSATPADNDTFIFIPL
jgi:hypothetical protein